MGRQLGMHKEDIKAAIRKKHGSLTALAKQHGYQSHHAISMTLNGPCPKLEAIIADSLGMEPKAIWPLRYLPDGTPRSGRPVTYKPNSKAIAANRNNQVLDAA